MKGTIRIYEIEEGIMLDLDFETTVLNTYQQSLDATEKGWVGQKGDM